MSFQWTFSSRWWWPVYPKSQKGWCWKIQLHRKKCSWNFYTSSGSDCQWWVVYYVFVIHHIYHSCCNVIYVFKCGHSLEKILSWNLMNGNTICFHNKYRRTERRWCKNISFTSCFNRCLWFSFTILCGKQISNVSNCLCNFVNHVPLFHFALNFPVIWGCLTNCFHCVWRVFIVLSLREK